MASIYKGEGEESACLASEEYEEITFPGWFHLVQIAILKVNCFHKRAEAIHSHVVLMQVSYFIYTVKTLGICFFLYS